MKRRCLLALGLVALLASAVPACHRDNNCPSTTSTTSATLIAGEAGLQTPASSSSSSPSPAVTAATTLPTVTPADLPNAPRADAMMGATSGSTARETPAAATATATLPIDISGPTPAELSTGSSTATTNPAPAGNGNAGPTPATATESAPLVAPGLDNVVTGGVANTGAPLNYGAGSPSPWFVPAPMSTMSRPR